MHTNISQSMMRLLILTLELAVLQACVDIAAVPVDRQASAGHGGAVSTGSTAIPPRGSEAGSTFSQMPDDSLWTLIARGDGRAIVGLKTPGHARGVYKSDILIGDSDIQAATRVLQGIQGLEILRRDTLLPIVIVRVQEARTLARIRQLPFVDYVNPDLIPGFTYAGSPGCTEYLWSGDQIYSPSGDIVPAVYSSLGVNNAWTRSNGENITIGLVDTGIFYNSQQLRLPGFTSGASASRSVRYWNTASFPSPWAECSHGTRMSGIMAAPRDGQGPIGVAWGASLVSVRHNDDVVVGAYGGDAQQGIRMAAQASHIVAMAWGTPDFLDNVGDEIRYWANEPTQPRLFIGAAGTQSSCATIKGSWIDVTPPPTLFPARMNEVVAVTAIDQNGKLACDAHGGPDVDVAAYYGYPTAGQYGQVLYMRGSSSATAVVAGMAALVWSHYGGGAAHTRQRLYETAAGYPNRAKYIGYGAVNAMRALGGMERADINGCTSSTCTFRYTIDSCRTEHFYVYPVGGDGPYSYQWSTGSTTNSTTLTLCPTPGEVAYYSLAASVWDADRLGATAAYRHVDIEVHDAWAPCPTCIQ
ncbi:MAG TPA: S8/S53 family peptidase [Longimicrobium sp.]|jgi:hypothetical protein|uniref:S8 family peptidase n=1 Tax=Longimicrobium sp. TaxID=2029185 RepID=UPI002EDBA5DD